MPRFNEKRAEAFAIYTVTALVRDARAEGKTFVKLSRAELAATLETQKLHEHHVEAVRAAAADEGIGMADLGHEFYFFDTSMKGATNEPGQDVLTHVTDAFLRLYPSEAANDLWDEGGYMPEAEPKVRRARRGGGADTIQVR